MLLLLMMMMIYRIHQSIWLSFPMDPLILAVLTRYHFNTSKLKFFQTCRSTLLFEFELYINPNPIGLF